MSDERVQEELLPSDEEVAEFNERGWYVSKRIYSDEEMDHVLEATDRFYMGNMDMGRLPNGMEGYEAKYSFPIRGIRKSDYASFFIPALRKIVRKPVLAAIAARLIGSPRIRLWHDQLLWKDPQEPGMKANVGWHTDRGYWQCCASENMLTAWVPFHDSDEEIGTITMIDGSHTWPAENNDTLNFFDSDLEGLEKKIVSDGKPVTKIPMILPRGHVSFHHCRLIHGSGPNLSNHPRRSVAVHLQDEANAYRRFVHPKSGRVVSHQNVEFCRTLDDGQPDFADPEICPTLFP